MDARRIGRPWASLTFRLPLWYAALFVVSAVALSALNYRLLATLLDRRDRELVESTLRDYGAEFEAGGLKALERAVQARERVVGGADLYIRVLSATGETILLRMAHGFEEFPPSKVEPSPRVGLLQWTEVKDAKGGDVLGVAAMRLKSRAVVEVGRTSRQRTEVLEQYRKELEGTSLIVLALGLGLGALFTRTALRPVRDMTQVVSRIIDTGRVSERVPAAEGNDPLRALARLFNTMLERLDRLVSAMRDSLDNVAHDLRTPMTRLQFTLEDALEARDVETARDRVADALAETERVTGTLNALLDLSEAEAGVMRLQREPAEVGALVEDAIELYSDVAQEKEVRVTSHCQGGLCVDVDRRRMRQALANLLDNALKYTPRGGAIEWFAAAEGPNVLLSIIDTGPGVPAEEQDRIWERLYRADHSRSERGLGIGLSLVRAIIRAHGGSTSVNSAFGHGAQFFIRLPAAVPAGPSPL